MPINIYIYLSTFPSFCLGEERSYILLHKLNTCYCSNIVNKLKSGNCLFSAHLWYFRVLLFFLLMPCHKGVSGYFLSLAPFFGHCQIQLGANESFLAISVFLSIFLLKKKLYLSTPSLSLLDN